MRGGDVEDTSSTWLGCRTRLHDAAEDGDLPRVELLVRLGANARAQDAQGNHPMHMAIMGHWGPNVAAALILKALLQAGADANAQNHHGDTPLSLAYQSSDLLSVRALISSGADPTIFGSEGTPAPPFVVDLLRDSDGGASTVVKILATGIDVNAKDKTNRTLLDRAAFCGSPSAVMALLRAGADATFETRFPPLCSAVALMQQEGGAESVRALFRAGADIHAEPMHIFGQRRRGIPLCEAVMHNSLTTVRLLLQLVG